MNIKESPYYQAAQARGIYDSPILTVGKSTHEWSRLFTWKELTNFYMGKDKPIKFGTLNEDMFDTIQKRILFLKGVIEDDVQTSIDRGILLFPNSTRRVELCRKWINEFARWDIKNEDNAMGFLFQSGVLRHVVNYDSIPIVHKLYVSVKQLKRILEIEV